jgi:dephospho-CoA kinase
MIIGLTGGISCGKSSVAADFFTEGFKTEDTDRIVREEVLPNPQVIQLALKRWGPSVLEVSARPHEPSEPRLARPKIAEIIFEAPAERGWWESIIHPRVRTLWRSRVAASPALDWVVEVPLLFEAGLEKEFDFIVCVGANPQTQLARAVARGMTQAQAGRRIASQLPLVSKLPLSHAVIWNDGDRDFLRRQVALLAGALRSA